MNSLFGLHFHSSLVSIMNSKFMNLGINSLGGAIMIDTSNLSLSNSTFQNNKALEGGAVYLSSSKPS